MDTFNFNDRPDRTRITETATGHAEINSDTVLTFLNFQWSYRQMQREYDELLETFQLSESKFIILNFLNHAKDSQLLPSEIAEKLGASRPTVSKLLRGMEKSQFVRKIASEHDKRSIYFQMTPKGRQAFESFLPDNFTSVQTFFSEFNANDLSQLNTLLKKIDAGTKKFQTLKEKKHARR